MILDDCMVGVEFAINFDPHNLLVAADAVEAPKSANECRGSQRTITAPKHNDVDCPTERVLHHRARDHQRIYNTGLRVLLSVWVMVPSGLFRPKSITRWNKNYHKEVALK